MSYCSRCGTQVVDTAHYCINCGSKLPYHNLELNYRYASLERRFVAFIIDRGVMAVLSAPSLYCVYDALHAYSFWTGSSSSMEQELIAGLLLLLLPSIYYLAKDSFFTGASIGKKMMRLYVINQRNQAPCLLAASVSRNIVFLATMVVIPVLPQVVNGFVLIFSKQHRSLGDSIANTIVLENTVVFGDLNH